jgi:hypothetical protein
LAGSRATSPPGQSRSSGLPRSPDQQGNTAGPRNHG